MINDYQVSQDPYCYLGSNVLKNKWGVHDARRLAEIEDIYSRQRMKDYRKINLFVARLGILVK